MARSRGPLLTVRQTGPRESYTAPTAQDKPRSEEPKKEGDHEHDFKYDQRILNAEVRKEWCQDQIRGRNTCNGDEQRSDQSQNALHT
jgi:hypothetical protein